MEELLLAEHEELPLPLELQVTITPAPPEGVVKGVILTEAVVDPVAVAEALIEVWFRNKKSDKKADIL